jgi:hypothetical protein
MMLPGAAQANKEALQQIQPQLQIGSLHISIAVVLRPSVASQKTFFGVF